jgi:hypothetical protein
MRRAAPIFVIAERVEIVAALGTMPEQTIGRVVVDPGLKRKRSRFRADFKL